MRSWILFALPVGLLMAQSPAPRTLDLSLQKAVEIALAPQGSPRVELALQAVRQSDTRVAQARSALLPNLDASVSGSSQTRNLQAFGISFPALPIPGFTGFPAIAGPFTVFDARVNGTQSVFDFALIRRYQAAKRSRDTAQTEVDAIKEQTAAQVARAYLSALRAARTEQTAKANVDLSQAILKLAQSQKNAGTGTAIDVTRAQVQLANDQQRLLIATNDRHRSHLQLLRAMGVELEAQLNLTDQMAYTPSDPVELQRAVALARDSRLELKAQQQRLDAARLNYESVKYERLPSLAAAADAGNIGTTVGNSLFTRSYGVSLRVPLFDGGRRDARRAEARLAYDSEQTRLRDLRAQVELEVRVAADTVQSAESQIAVARDGARLAEQELAQARRRYEAGVSNSVEVTDAQTRLQRALDNQTAALFQYNLARIDLTSAMGRIETYLAKP
jgi:outer membrane protein TolC